MPTGRNISSWDRFLTNLDCLNLSAFHISKNSLHISFNQGSQAGDVWPFAASPLQSRVRRSRSGRLEKSAEYRELALTASGCFAELVERYLAKFRSSQFFIQLDRLHS